MVLVCPVPEGRQIELWTGQKAPLDVMRKELKEIIREENEKAQTE